MRVFYLFTLASALIAVYGLYFSNLTTASVLGL